MKLPTCLCLFVCLLTSAAMGDTYLVKPDGTGDYPNIQAAIDAASNGDEVLLANGIFRGAGNINIEFRGKSIMVRSESGCAQDCVIEPEGIYGQPGRRGFDFIDQEGPDSIVRDLTIRGGATDDC